MTAHRHRFLGIALASAVLLLGACSSSTTSAPATSWGSQTSAENGGGINALVSAAKREGKLNIIALPREWANYGAIIDAFQAKYGIKVNSADPNVQSQDEVDAVTSLAKSGGAPDVLDLNMKVALANVALLAPYEMSEWADIPTAQKDAGGLWYQDYGGYMSIGFDSNKVPPVALVDDLLKSIYKGKIFLKADPTVDDTAMSAVMMVALAEGGSIDNIGPGVDFFHQLKAKGNFVSTRATTASIKSGLTPVVLDWEYLSRAHVADVPTWQVVIPDYAVLGGFFAQAINKHAPHPAAARLWEEFLYSNEGQNLWLQGGVRPVRMPSMRASGQIDFAAAAALPSLTGSPVFMTPEQVAKASHYLATNWAKAIS